MIQRSQDTLYVQPLPSHLVDHVNKPHMDAASPHIVVKRSLKRFLFRRMKHNSFKATRGILVLTWYLTMTPSLRPWSLNSTPQPRVKRTLITCFHFSIISINFSNAWSATLCLACTTCSSLNVKVSDNCISKTVSWFVCLRFANWESGFLFLLFRFWASSVINSNLYTKSGILV